MDPHTAPTEQNPNQTYQELLRSIRVVLKKKYSQKPQLSSSHPMVGVALVIVALSAGDADVLLRRT